MEHAICIPTGKVSQFLPAMASPYYCLHQGWMFLTERSNWVKVLKLWGSYTVYRTQGSLLVPIAIGRTTGEGQATGV